MPLAFKANYQGWPDPPPFSRTMNAPPFRRLTRLLCFEQLETRTLLAGDMIRTIDGHGNNQAHPEWGAAHTALVRLTEADYVDGLSTPSAADRPSARVISNTVNAQTSLTPNARQLTDYVWIWGQFLDHDLGLTEAASPPEPFNVQVPAGDPHFDPLGDGTVEIGLNRSVYDSATGITSPREQVNEITAYIDASNVYGSSEERAAALRTFSGGTMKVSDGDLLPFNVDHLPNAMGPSEEFFVAGDVRANENVLLTAMHTVFVREHNRLATKIAASEYTGFDIDDPEVDEAIYQKSREYVAALLQSITYHEFLPALLGAGAVPPYATTGGYDASANAGIANEFSAAAFRVGHTMLSPSLQMVAADGATDSVPLLGAFFNPTLLAEVGVDDFLRGAATQRMQEVDPYIIDDVRNFLFGPPGAGGFDLASLNIQRGRDHGLPPYNESRSQLGLEPVSTFSQISSDNEVVSRLQQAYGHVDDVDFWVGALAEDHLTGRSVGQLLTAVMEGQFHRTRAGDRFYYEHALEPSLADEVSNTRLADVIARNTGWKAPRENIFLSSSVFYYRPDVGSEVRLLRLNSEDGVYRLVDRLGNVVQQAAAADVDAIVVEGPVDGSEFSLHLDAAASPDAPIAIGNARVLSVENLSPDDMLHLSDNVMTINGAGEIIVGGVETIAIDGVRPVERSLGSSGDGVPAHDDGRGLSYLMHSTFPVAERFPSAPTNAASHLAVVVAIDGVWHYDNGSSLTPFLPHATDTLLAEVSVATGDAIPLANTLQRVHGSVAGYFDSGLTVDASGGWLQVTGTAFKTYAVDKHRTLSGAENNQWHADWGAVGTPFRRMSAADYEDGVSAPAGDDRPMVRTISNDVSAQNGDVANERGLSDLVWAWGQLISGDVYKVGASDESFNMQAPPGDRFLDPWFKGTATMPQLRSQYIPGMAAPREQVNLNSSFLDGSVIYGTATDEAVAIRLGTGGRLIEGNASSSPTDMSALRSPSENALVDSLRQLFVREHNRWADELADTKYASHDGGHPMVDEAIYQQARQMVGAILQSITYHEFLPALLGAGAVPAYDAAGGYDPGTDASIANEFFAAAQFTHSAISPRFVHWDKDQVQDVRFMDTLFNPSVSQSMGVDGFLIGAATQRMQEVDPLAVNSIRNFMFGPAGMGGMDFVAATIQQGRDHGLPSYNEVRRQLGLTPAASFGDISSEPAIVEALASVYQEPESVDFWLGGLAEDHLPGSSVGELFSAVLAEQFHRVRTGDRFYFEHTLPTDGVVDISNTRLSDVIARNTIDAPELQENVFFVDSVLHFRPDAGTNLDVTVSAHHGLVTVTNAAGETIQKKLRGEIESLVIQGPADGSPLHVTLDLTTLPLTPIEAGNLATLEVLRSPDQEVVWHGDSVLIVGEHQISMNAIDELLFPPPASEPPVRPQRLERGEGEAASSTGNEAQAWSAYADEGPDSFYESVIEDEATERRTRRESIRRQRITSMATWTPADPAGMERLRKSPLAQSGDGHSRGDEEREWIAWMELFQAIGDGSLRLDGGGE